MSTSTGSDHSLNEKYDRTKEMRAESKTITLLHRSTGTFLSFFSMISKNIRKTVAFSPFSVPILCTTPYKMCYGKYEKLSSRSTDVSRKIYAKIYIVLRKRCEGSATGCIFQNGFFVLYTTFFTGVCMYIRASFSMVSG